MSYSAIGLQFKVNEKHILDRGFDTEKHIKQIYKLSDENSVTCPQEPNPNGSALLTEYTWQL